LKVLSFTSDTWRQTPRKAYAKFTLYSGFTWLIHDPGTTNDVGERADNWDRIVNWHELTNSFAYTGTSHYNNATAVTNDVTTVFSYSDGYRSIYDNMTTREYLNQSARYFFDEKLRPICFCEDDDRAYYEHLLKWPDMAFRQLGTVFVPEDKNIVLETGEWVEIGHGCTIKA